MQFLCLTIDYNEGEKKGLATGELNLSWILIHSMTFPISNVKGRFCKLIDRKRLLCSEFTSNLNITANITPWFKGFWKSIMEQFCN